MLFVLILQSTHLRATILFEHVNIYLRMTKSANGVNVNKTYFKKLLKEQVYVKNRNQAREISSKDKKTSERSLS